MKVIAMSDTINFRTLCHEAKPNQSSTIKQSKLPISFVKSKSGTKIERDSKQPCITMDSN